MTQTVIGITLCWLIALGVSSAKAATPNIVLVMTDDQGWGQLGVAGHPRLKTPHLDAMANNGLRFDRFYAGAPVCSPTRASVLTGRTNMRTGVQSHGYALRHQEKTLAEALKQAGYATGHFGKWHLNGLRGPGVPILKDDPYHPGRFGFDTWLSVTNFFDMHPVMSRQGVFEEFEGDSSGIIVAGALEFMEQQMQANRPFLSVIWYGTPHAPFMASDADKALFADLDEASQDQHGELVAMDRSMGALRTGLRSLGIAEDTLLWFCSDNGGLAKIQPETVGGLRANKGSLYEGGIRVPAIVEWPKRIRPGRVTHYPASTLDIFPTLAEIVDLPDSTRAMPQDGDSLNLLFDRDLARRAKPIPFQCFGETALIDNEYKLLQLGRNKQAKRYELYDLDQDPTESKDLYKQETATAERMTAAMTALQTSIQRSFIGADYPEKRLQPADPEPRFWTTVKGYKPYFETWRKRPEYRSRLQNF